jgi:aminopeptidase N
LFFNALRLQIGDEAFQRALQQYYLQNRFQLVPPQTLLTSFSDACGCDLSQLYQIWGVVLPTP